jgi:N-acetylglutamate synthase
VAEPAGAPGDDPLTAPRVLGGPGEFARVRELEELGHRAWLPLHSVPIGGWLARSSAGSSRRGNSVWARRPVDDIPAAIAEVERFYAAHGTPPTFQLTPTSTPAGLPGALDAAGYDDTGPTDVCVADLARLDLGPRGPSVAPSIAARPGEAWLSVAGAVMSTFGPRQRAGSLAVLGGLRVEQAYVLVTLHGQPVAAGRGTLDGDWLGIYSMATLPAARGRGAASAVLGALAGWASEGGASRAYLQVERTSIAARRLYARFGFQPVYHYTYRRRTP